MSSLSLRHPRHLAAPRSRRWIAPALAAFFFALLPKPASAEELLIKDPGEHPSYIIDAEPHGLVGFGPMFDKAVFGAGFRGTFILVQNGFVRSINDSVGIGVGADLLLNGNRHNNGVALYVPVVMQWNFWLSTHWTVFGEPGAGFGFGTNHLVNPIIAVGGRYAFTEKIALTMRIGYPAASVGVSFYF